MNQNPWAESLLNIYTEPPLGLSSAQSLQTTDENNADQNHQILNPARCFHCHLPVPEGFDLTASIENVDQPMCCHGCKAVADAIAAAGHENFYRVRTEISPTGQELVPEFLRETQVYDNESVQQEFVQQVSGTDREASLILEGITCAACVWLNEQHIGNLDGVIDVQVNYASRRAWVRWDDSRIRLSEILQAIREIGYQAHPYNPDQQQALQQKERRTQIKRLAIAGLFGMQVMMLSISLYAGAWSGMEDEFQHLFRWLSLGLTLPVLFFSATTFFRSAAYDLFNRRVGMDVPVSLAIGIAFISSAIATVQGHGEIYFDSVVMFVFLLLVSRYFEWMARQRSAESVERLAHALPMMASRLLDDGQQEEVIAASMLQVDDIVLVRPGETIPADGELVVGQTSVDESLLNGESRPLDRCIGEQLVGGSINITNPIQVKVQSVGSDTVLSSIHRMIERAQSDKPPMARLADRIASRFIFFVLTMAVLVAGYWWLHDSTRWLEVTLSVLIVSCPCALSLATPAAISAALSRLQNFGLLVKRGQAIDALDKVTHIVFDKTGTLTQGKPVFEKVICDEEVDSDDCLRIAASLENYSEHPIGKAIVQAAQTTVFLPVTKLVNQTGSGLSAYINNRHYAIGSIDYVQKFSNQTIKQCWIEQACNDCATVVALATADKILCLFILQDEIRADAFALIQSLKKLNKKVLLMSGDGESVVKQVSASIGIEQYYAALAPEQKMSKVRALQSGGATVLMVGDGINDAPVLSNADVSVAMGSATALAKTSADIVLLSNRLGSIFDGLKLSSKTQSIVKQNLSWALAYNICAIPAAAAGFITPWMAAIGMSVSSLIVVVNALRLTIAQPSQD